MDSPLLTLVIPVRNRPELIRRLLDCIDRELSSTTFRTIIVDNGSTDATPSVVEAWIDASAERKSRVILLHEKIAGAPAARNRGMEMTTTPYIMFFDSDDTFMPGHIARIERYLSVALNEGKQPGIVRWSVKMSLSGMKRKLAATPMQATLLNHIFHASLATQRYCAPTELVRQAGGWDNDVKVWNDLELGVRLLLLNGSASELIEGEPMVEIEAQSDSITGVRWADKWKERAYALDKIEKDLVDYGRDDLRFAIDFRRMILAAILRQEGEGQGSDFLRQSVLRKYSGMRNIQLRLVYSAQRLFGRGGSFLGMVFS